MNKRHTTCLQHSHSPLTEIPPIREGAETRWQDRLLNNMHKKRERTFPQFKKAQREGGKHAQQGKTPARVFSSIYRNATCMKKMKCPNRDLPISRKPGNTHTHARTFTHIPPPRKQRQRQRKHGEPQYSAVSLGMHSCTKQDW